MKTHSKTQGFTLIELLVVIAIIAILATVVFVALDPVRRFADARNARRFSDVNSLLTAVHEYVIDNDGVLPSGINATEKQLGTCSSGGATLCPTAAAACLDLASPLVPYLKTMPLDPRDGSAATTGYSVVSDANGIVTIKSCSAENSVSVQVSR